MPGVMDHGLLARYIGLGEGLAVVLFRGRHEETGLLVPGGRPPRVRLGTQLRRSCRPVVRRASQHVAPRQVVANLYAFVELGLRLEVPPRLEEAFRQQELRPDPPGGLIPLGDLQVVDGRLQGAASVVGLTDKIIVVFVGDRLRPSGSLPRLGGFGCDAQAGSDLVSDAEVGPGVEFPLERRGLP